MKLAHMYMCVCVFGVVNECLGLQPVRCSISILFYSLFHHQPSIFGFLSKYEKGKLYIQCYACISGKYLCRGFSIHT